MQFPLQESIVAHRVRALLQEQQRLLGTFFSSVDVQAIERVVRSLYVCKGSVILFGIGKSGHVAEKIAASFNSTGTRAQYLCPVHALHGDLGFVSSQDVCLLFSKSGETQELLDLIPHLRRKKCSIIAVVSHAGSRLAKVSDFFALLPVEKELCPFNLAPTISTTVQMLFGDCVAIALMEKRQFSQENFVSNHPSGFLGKKMTLTVSDLMLTGDSLPICGLADRLIDVLHELSKKRCGCLLVCEDSVLQGIFTDGDLRRAIEKEGAAVLQRQLVGFFSPFPLTIGPDVLAFDAMRLMEQDPSRLVTVLPVIEQGKVIGLLRMHDILQAGLR